MSAARSSAWLSLLLVAAHAGGDALLFLDGDCPKGADRQGRQVAADLGCVTEQVPPKDGTYEALLERDRVIAQRCHVLIACPLTDQERERSGTWYTVRQARDLRRPVLMLSRGGRKPASQQRLAKALDDVCGRAANEMAVEVCTRVPDDVVGQMRAYLHRKVHHLCEALWTTG